MPPPGTAEVGVTSTRTVLCFTGKEAAVQGGGQFTQGPFAINRPATQGRIAQIKGGDHRSQVPDFTLDPVASKFLNFLILLFPRVSNEDN